MLTRCIDTAEAPAWCVAGTVLDFGDDADLRPAQEDYDADGVAEPVSVELQDLRGTKVRVLLTEQELVDLLPRLVVPPLETVPPKEMEPGAQIED